MGKQHGVHFTKKGESAYLRETQPYSMVQTNMLKALNGFERLLLFLGRNPLY